MGRRASQSGRERLLVARSASTRTRFGAPEDSVSQVTESQLEVGEYAVGYLKRLSPNWRLYAAIEGG
jgi:hypothetical protein